MNIITLITVFGFILTVIILLFTGEGEEIKENIEYRLRGFIKKIKVPKRGLTDIQQSLVVGDKKISSNLPIDELTLSAIR